MAGPFICPDFNQHIHPLSSPGVTLLPLSKLFFIFTCKFPKGSLSKADDLEFLPEAKSCRGPSQWFWLPPLTLLSNPIIQPDYSTSFNDANADKTGTKKCRPSSPSNLLQRTETQSSPQSLKLNFHFVSKINMSLTLWVMSPRVDQVFFGMVFMWGAGGSDKFRAIVCERAIRPPMRAPDTRIVPTAPTTYLLYCRPLTKSDPRYILFQSFKTGFFVPMWPPELSSFLSRTISSSHFPENLPLSILWLWSYD